MTTNEIRSTQGFVKQQTGALKKIFALITACEDKGLMDTVEPTELQQLKDYTGDMMLACSTIGKLADALQSVLEKEEDKKAKKAEPKKEKKPVEKAKPEPAEKPDENDDDLSWLE